MVCRIVAKGFNCTGSGAVVECGNGYVNLRIVKGLSGAEYAVAHVKGSNELKLGFDRLSEFSSLGDFMVARYGECWLMVYRTAHCYNMGEVGPYGISSTNVEVSVKDGDLVARAGLSGYEYCDFLIIASPDPHIIDLRGLPRPLPLIYDGFFEDGLIWALVRAGYVKESELPSFIRPGQAYLWARGDVVYVSLGQWVETGNAFYLDILKLAYEMLLRLMNEHGGVKIPYITAARARDVYGSPQQSYIFNTLLRGFELAGDGRYLEGALRALKCYTVQPPHCLGYIDLGGGLRWFRWGSRHFLSTDPQGWENLMVLNTHLMGVLSMAEAGVRGLCDWCLGEARNGLEAFKRMLGEFQRSDGYLYYSLYSKSRMGPGEDDKYPPYRGYSLLSSRLAMKAAIYLNDQGAYEAAKRACMMGYGRVIEGSWSEFEAAARCLSLIQLREGNVLGKMIDVLSKAHDKGVRVVVNGYDVEGAFAARYQPTIIAGSADIVYIGPVDDYVAVLLWSRGTDKAYVRGYSAPSGHSVLVRGIEVEAVDGVAKVGEGEVEFKGGVLLKAKLDISGAAVRTHGLGAAWH